MRARSVFDGGASLLALVLALNAGTAPGASAGNEASSLKPLAPKDWSDAHAAHLLRRAGFGGPQAEIEKLAAMGLDAAVAHLVDYQQHKYDPAPPPVPEELFERPDRRERSRMTEEERRAEEERRRRLERQALEETRLWWLERMLESPRPLEEKLVLFWHGHFTSGAREVRSAVFMKEQNDLFRRLAAGSFRELLLAVSKDRAMLTYLDGNRNNKKQPNENYARELLELFTLGEGNYSESDIKAAARAFTGWGYDEDGFVIRKAQHDDGRKTFLRRTGDFGGEEIVSIVLEQPECARFLAAKLLRYFVRPDPSRALQEALAREIRRHDYQLRPVLRTLFSSEAFYHPEARGSLVKSPVELVVGASRALEAPVGNLELAERAVASMGQELFQPPNVKGWPGGPHWITTATVYQRYNTVNAMITGPPDGVRAIQERRRRQRESNDEAEDAEGGMMAQADTMTSESMRDAARPTPKSRRDGRAQRPLNPMSLLPTGVESAEQIVDALCARLLAVELPPEKRAALLEYLSRNATADDQDRLRMVVQLICSSPEFQRF